MTHSVIDLKKYQRELGYGDHRAIRERLAEKGVDVSKSAISQVIRGTYYNEAILDMAKEVLTAKHSVKE
jgi:SOS response regulatory protein OraA/RecX